MRNIDFINKKQNIKSYIYILKIYICKNIPSFASLVNPGIRAVTSSCMCYRKKAKLNVDKVRSI